MARKVFISNLGTGFYEKCKYSLGSFYSSETKFAQQAVLELIEAKNWGSRDKLIILTTDKAKELNWDLEVRKSRDGEIDKYSGLKQILDRMNLAAEIKNINVPHGMDEEQIWEIFRIIFDELGYNDELYIDLTHSFRYHPMLLLVLSNYAKFLRNIKVVHMSYGNFESKENNIAPIIDLLPIASLQDWTFAAADYLENGNASRLTTLSRNTLEPILRDNELRNENSVLMNRLISSLETTADDFRICRGMNIVRAQNIKTLKNLLIETESSFIKPLSPIINKIEQVFKPFETSPNTHNGFHSAFWCYNNGLYQQSITILQESIITYFCEKHNIMIDDEEKRDIINSAFTIVNYNIPEEKWRVKDEFKVLLSKMVDDEELKDRELNNSFERISNIRNDFNHFGMRMRNSPMKSRTIKENIKKEIEVVFQIFKIEQ